MGAAPDAQPAVPAAVHARHVALLDAAARNQEIRTDEVLALATAWQPEIDDAALARLHARAMELGVRDGAARALALRERVLDDLALLLARADGELPRAAVHAYVEALASRAREQQIARIRAALAQIDADGAGATRASAGGVAAMARAALGLGARGADRRTARAGGALAGQRPRCSVELLLRALALARRARGLGRATGCSTGSPIAPSTSAIWWRCSPTEKTRASRSRPGA